MRRPPRRSAPSSSAAPSRGAVAPGRRRFLQGAAAVGVSFNLPAGAFAQDGRGGTGGKVNFYNYDTYIGETTLDDFEEATGIEVQYDLFADNEELFAKLRGGNPGYDVIVPSNEYVERLILAELLQPLDKARIPNAKNIDPAFADPAFDPGRTYTMPYMWGTIGIGYRKSAVSTEPTSWNDLYTSDEYAGRIALMSNPVYVMQMALKAMGKSINDWSPENIAAAEKMIIDQKGRIVAFAPDNGQDLLLAGEVDLAQEWNGDILQVMSEDDDIGYVVPKEGGILWEDCLCIPVGAPNVENAHALIDYLLDAEAGAKIAEYIYYATPNLAARELMDDDYTQNPAIFPPQSAIESSEVSVYPGPEISRLVDEAWTRIKAAG